MSTPRQLWLEEYDKESTRKLWSWRFERFLKWSNKTDIELVEEFKQSRDQIGYAKKYGKIMLKYFDYLVNEKGIARGTAKSEVASVRAFFSSQTISLKIKKGTMKSNSIALGEHEFSLAELQQIYRVSDIREKVLLSVGIGLGWSISDFLSLTWEYINPYIDSKEQVPIGFWYNRKKTESPCRAHFNHEMISDLKALRDSLANPSGRIFDITPQGLNKMFQTMVRKANIQLRGTKKPHFHQFRKILASSLANSGVSDIHIRLMLGKRIDPSMLTYLKDQTETLRKEYLKAEKFFSLTGITNGDIDTMGKMQNRIDELENAMVTFVKVAKERGIFPLKELPKALQELIEKQKEKEKNDA